MISESVVINVHDLTKDYGSNRGVFNVNLQVKKGQCHGFLGPNGAGKTTTIRHIMGFQKASKVNDITISDIPIWDNQSTILQNVGYLPGELAFPESFSGNYYIKFIANMRKVKNLAYANKLILRFKLNVFKKIKAMSLGEKRKLAIVVAFMHNPDIFVLDEPTSGLDPLMQEEFIKYILEEKQNGKTILLSSHIYSEVEKLCDYISIIKDGRVVSAIDIDEVKIHNIKKYKIEFNNNADYNKMIKNNFNFEYKISEKNQVCIVLEDDKINTLFSVLKKYDVKYIAEYVFTLEDYFMKFYKK